MYYCITIPDLTNTFYPVAFRLCRGKGQILKSNKNQQFIYIVLHRTIIYRILPIIYNMREYYILKTVFNVNKNFVYN